MQFARHGIPVVVHTDGGLQFVSEEFREFAQLWKFQHTLSSAYNSQPNGKAESAVKTVKRTLKRSADPWLALLEWRNTPTVWGPVPASGCSPEEQEVWCL